MKRKITACFCIFWLFFFRRIRSRFSCMESIPKQYFNVLIITTNIVVDTITMVAIEATDFENIEF